MTAHVVGNRDIRHTHSRGAETAEATGESEVTTITRYLQDSLDGELAGRALPVSSRPSASQIRPPATTSDERGSIPLALLAVIVISGVMSIMMATTLSAQRQARHGSNFSTVLYTADAAV
ncbi:MAG TPA: hypothetical protein VM287_01045, partial [Egibacteraceae bacterium]|nr:hypothetical protein [Egibacteraceae bacterium]